MEQNTTDKVEWRWDLLRGANHYVVNISCPTKEELEKRVQKIIQQKH
jgi:hypothetical protein